MRCSIHPKLVGMGTWDPFKNHPDATVIFFQPFNWNTGKPSDLSEFRKIWAYGSSHMGKFTSVWWFLHCFCEGSIPRANFPFWFNLKLSYIVGLMSFLVLWSCILRNICRMRHKLSHRATLLFPSLAWPLTAVLAK